MDELYNGEVYIPSNYLILYPEDEALDKRDITVRKFSTDVPFDRSKIAQSLRERRLRKGDNFGVIQTYKEQTDEDIRALCGLTGIKNLTLLDQNDDIKRLGVRHTIVSTLMVEFLANQESGNLDLLVYGGPQGQKDLWEMLRCNFGVQSDPIPLYLSLDGIRLLCEEFFLFLFEIVTDPTQQDGYGNIIEADLKANKREFILSNADRMQQILNNKNIRIRSFRSIIPQQTIPSLRSKYEVRFRVLKDSGIRLEIPALSIRRRLDPNFYEIVMYDFARYVYAQIVKDRNIYTNTFQESESNNDNIPLQLMIPGLDNA